MPNKQLKINSKKSIDYQNFFHFEFSQCKKLSIKNKKTFFDNPKNLRFSCLFFMALVVVVGNIHIFLME